MIRRGIYTISLLVLLPMRVLGQGDSLAIMRDFASSTRKELSRLQYLSQAGVAARASVNVLDNETAALVALQAYNFNSANFGNPFDVDIHRALLGIWDRYHYRVALPKEDNLLSGRLIGTAGKAVWIVDPAGTLHRLTQTGAEWRSESLFALPEYSANSLVVISPEGADVIYVPEPSKSLVYLYRMSSSGAFRVAKHFELDPPVNQAVFLSGALDFLVLHNGGRTLSKFSGPQQQRISLNRPLAMISLSPCDHFLAGTDHEKWWIWNMDPFKMVDPGTVGDSTDIATLAFAPDECANLKLRSAGYRLVTVTTQGEWKFFYLGSLMPPRRSHMGLRTPVMEIVFSSNPLWMGIGDRTGVQIWNWQKPNDLPIEISSETPVRHFTFSPDEDYVLIQTDSIRAYPIHTRVLADPICNYIHRNMTKNEWNTFMDHFPYERTCQGPPANNR